ncbi:hypothetical protein GCM10009539_55440 [Cryptosporangium japonicum]|uniref:PKD domain-containing protein n=1 Tax=Cryptosporangium japonicum TaxID=80872 RepID=A0ABN0UVB5_9ACTN
MRAGLALAVLVAALAFGVPAAAEPPPSGGATCPPGEDCSVSAERPGGTRPRPRPPAPENPGPRGPVERACNNPAFCPPAEGQPAEAENAQQVALREFATIPIKGPQIGVAPDPGGSGLVGLPVWLWTAVTPQTWGPFTATAAVPGLTVTATAVATRITWNMGDGKQVVCDNPGTPYLASYGNKASPNCGYRYARAGTYTVTGTTDWVVTWTGGGQTGQIPQTRETTTTIRIDELQVVTQ